MNISNFTRLRRFIITSAAILTLSMANGHAQIQNKIMADSLSPNDVVVGIFEGLRPFFFRLNREFIITPVGPDCRQYQGVELPLLFKACIQNFSDARGMKVQRLSYHFRGTTPYTLTVSHNSANFISHSDLFSWELPLETWDSLEGQIFSIHIPFADTTLQSFFTVNANQWTKRLNGQFEEHKFVFSDQGDFNNTWQTRRYPPLGDQCSEPLIYWRNGQELTYQLLLGNPSDALNFRQNCTDVLNSEIESLTNRILNTLAKIFGLKKF